MNLQTLYAAIVAKLTSMFTTRKTIGSIVATMNKQVDQLRATAQRHQNDAAAQYAKSEALEDAADANVDEAVRASRIAANFARLVN